MGPLALALLLTAAPKAAPDGGSPPPSPTVRVLFAGDVTLGYHHEEYVDELVAKKGLSREAALGWGFAKVGPVTRAADLFVVNLECPFTVRGEKLTKNFNFRARPELVATLLAGGVDVVSLANNHLMDYGLEGLADTLSTLDAHGIKRFGAGPSLAAARAPALLEVKGVRFAFLGYFFLGDRNIEPREVIAAGDAGGVAGHFSDTAALEALLREDIAAAKAVADVVIPFFHWGREGRPTPEPYQVRLAHAAVEAGAAAVIGSHPHVLQGMESYRGAPIVYSLGNFVFGGNWDPKDKHTALVELAFSRAGFQGARVLPATSDAFPERPVQPELAQGDAGVAVLEHLRAISKDFAAPLLR